MERPSEARVAAEAQARSLIDAQLTAGGWSVEAAEKKNLRPYFKGSFWLRRSITI